MSTEREMTRCRTCGREMTREEFWDHVGAHGRD